MEWILIDNCILGCVDRHFLHDVGEELYCLIWGQHLCADCFVSSATQIISHSQPISTRIQSALHEFTSLYCKVLTFLFNVSQAGVKVTTNGE